MNTTKQLSKGCQLCQKGKWLCIFLTYKCTAGCHFCPAPFKNDEIHSAFGSNKEKILNYLKESNFEGISFSGGDPFLVFDRLLEWQTFFKKELSNYYYWVYTNGLAADQEKIKKLANAGMDEIRFNIAATDYLSSKIWDRIKIARKYFSFVSIEIPSIQNDYLRLCEALNKIEDYGIDYLNLHDYIISESEMDKTNEPINYFLLNKTNQLKYTVSSVENTFKIIEYSKQKGYTFKINHCSMQQKEEQMLQRRLKMGAIFNNPEYDIEMEDGTFCNYYEYRSDFPIDKIEQYGFEKHFLLNSINTIIPIKRLPEQLLKGNKIVRATFIPPLEIYQDKIFLDWQVINILDK